MIRWLKWLMPLAVIACGAVMLVTGFVYEVVFAGIPYQDPPPDLAARYVFHAQVASTITWGGVLIMALGALGLGVVTVWALARFWFS